jgi:hypothetical protein
MLQFPAPPGYRRRERPVWGKLGPYMAWIDGVLEADRFVHKKQRPRQDAYRAGAGACGVSEKLYLVMLADASIHAFDSGQKTAWHRQKGVDPRSREGDGGIGR